jgi:hypothetical protein
MKILILPLLVALALLTGCKGDEKKPAETKPAQQQSQTAPPATPAPEAATAPKAAPAPETAPAPTAAPAEAPNK